MSGMTIGSMIEADRRLRDYETRARRMRKLRRDQAVWRAYEDDYSNAKSKSGVGGGVVGGQKEEKRMEVKNAGADGAKNR